MSNITFARSNINNAVIFVDGYTKPSLGGGFRLDHLTITGTPVHLLLALAMNHMGLSTITILIQNIRCQRSMALELRERIMEQNNNLWY
jgi:hypothetical protein